MRDPHVAVLALEVDALPLEGLDAPREELALTTKVLRQTHVRIDHAYALWRGETLLAEAQTTAQNAFGRAETETRNLA